MKMDVKEIKFCSFQIYNLSVWLLTFFVLTVMVGCFISCDLPEICEQKFEINLTGDCIEVLGNYGDSMLIIGPHIYPEEVQAFTGVSYDFSIETDPNRIILYMSNGKIVKEERGRCNIRLLIAEKNVPDGISVIRQGDCLLANHNDQGAVYLVRRNPDDHKLKNN